MTLAKFSGRYPAFMESLFDNQLFDWSNRNFSSTNTTLPSVNIKEDADKFEVEMAAPGFDKKDFKVALNNNLLTISSEKQVEAEIKEGQQFNRREFSYQSFSRSFALPTLVDRENISAVYDNGILRIAVPKREEAKPKPNRLIAIS